MAKPIDLQRVSKDTPATRRGRPRKNLGSVKGETNFSKFIGELIKAQGTQQAVIRQLGRGLTQSHLSGLCSGRLRPNSRTVATLLRVCTPAQAQQLISAFLNDELAAIKRLYRPLPKPEFCVDLSGISVSVIGAETTSATYKLRQPVTLKRRRFVPGKGWVCE